MQKYDDFTREQLDRIDEVFGAFEEAIKVLLDLPQDIREKYGVKPKWEDFEIHSYAMGLADHLAENLAEEGHPIYFPWQNEETGIHDILKEEV